VVNEFPVVCRLRIVDDHLFLHARDLQRDRLIRRTATQRQLALVGLESGKLDVQLNVPERQWRRHRKPALVGGERNGLAARGCDNHSRLGNSRTGFVDDDQAQLGLVSCGLSRKWRRNEERHQPEDDPRHFVNVLALKLGLIL
jgi:hypothetical protein